MADEDPIPIDLNLIVDFLDGLTQDPDTGSAADVTIRSGSLNPDADPPQVRAWDGEWATSTDDFTANTPTLREWLTSIALQAGLQIR